MAVRPASALERSFSCSSPPPPPLRRCCCCQPSRCTALHRAVTKLDDALPHGLQHRRESRSSTPACYRSNAEPLGLKAPTAASRSPMHAALARSPEPAPAGGCARCWPDHQLRANFPGARAAQSASPPRSGARRKKWAWWGTGRTRFATEVDTKVFYGENLFCRQSRETCETGLGSRGSHVFTDVYQSLSEGLPPERTSPSARRGRRHPVRGGGQTREKSITPSL